MNKIYSITAGTMYILSGAFFQSASSQERTTHFMYDGSGNLTQIQTPTGETITATYDQLRRLVEIQAHDGRKQINSFNSNHTLASVSIQTSDGHSTFSTRFEYDNRRLKTAAEDPELNKTLYEYDELGRIFRTIDPENRISEHRYTAAGVVYCTIDAVGTNLQQTYQRLELSPWDTPKSYLPARGSDNDCTEIDNAFETRVEFDAFGNLAKTTYPHGTSVSVVSDAGGNPLQRLTRKGELSTFDYNSPIGQLTQRVRNVGNNEDVMSYSYDTNGAITEAKLVRSNGSSHQTNYFYDSFGHLTVERSNELADVGYTYDRSGRRTSIIWPDLWTARYVYDASGRLSEVWADPDGVAPCSSLPDRCGNTMAGNGDENQLAEYQYDNAGRLGTVHYGGDSASATSSVSYTYEDNGDMSTETHVFINESVTFQYGYDKSRKLTSSSASDASWLWLPQNASLIQYGAVNNLDQYSDVESTALSYDLNGNITTSQTGHIYDYNSDNQLISAQVSNVVTNYLYDANGRRVSKQFNDGTATHFLHAGIMEIAEYSPDTSKPCPAATIIQFCQAPSSSLNVQIRYVPGLGVDQRIAMIRDDGVTNYFHADRMGNVIAMADASGQKSAQYVYSPFGVESNMDFTGNPFRFTGRRFDSETQLYHYRARYYDPKLGRFLQTDPIGFADQMNLYTYVGNDPLGFVDPLGTRRTPPPGIGHNGGPPIEPVKPQGGAGIPTGMAGRLLQPIAIITTLGSFTPNPRIGNVDQTNVLVTRVNNTITDHLTTEDLTAASRELAGETVATRPDGSPYDHVKEVREAQASLRNTIRDAKDLQRDARTSDAAKEKLDEVISRASRTLDYTERFVPPPPPPPSTPTGTPSLPK